MKNFRKNFWKISKTILICKKNNLLLIYIILVVSCFCLYAAGKMKIPSGYFGVELT